MNPNDPKTTTLPGLGQPAPAFEVKTTHGIRRLADYQGRWLVLFSHPADFTPVCTTEFAAFARAHPRFEALGCDLLGLSIDSTHAHIAWMRSIEASLGVKVEFPIIEDLSMEVSRAYGMLQPGASDTAAVRAVFVIDPHGVLRAMLYYPMSSGRSIDEIVRLLQSLQTCDAEKCATPEGWQPGDPVIVPPAATMQEAAERRAKAESEGWEYIDYYLCKRPLGRRAESPQDAVRGNTP